MGVWHEETRLYLAEPESQTTAKLEQVVDREDNLIESSSSRSEEFRRVTQTVSIEQIRRVLGKSALVEFVSFPEVLPSIEFVPLPDQLSPFNLKDSQLAETGRYGAYVLSDGQITWHDLGPVAVINQLVRRYRYAIRTSSNQAMARQSAQELDRLTFRPIRRSLPGTTDFYLAPDGALSLIPFGALVDENGAYLIQR